jgi:hypothetical protein
MATGTTPINIPGPTTVEQVFNPDILAPQQEFSLQAPPVYSTAVPGDPKTAPLALTKDPLAVAYGNAGINRATVLKSNELTRANDAKKAQASKLELKKKADVAELQKQINDGFATGQEEVAQYKALQKAPELGYVTAAQAKLYIGGILVDECYDLQYQYKEYKEPVYGYNDKHWGAILKGTVIVSGSFTINYKHDAYLIKLLEKVNSKGSDGTAESAYKKKLALESDVENYKESLAHYKAIFNARNDILARDKQNDIKIEELTAHLELQRKGEARINADFALKSKNNEKAKTDFMATLSPEDKEQVLKDETKFVLATKEFGAVADRAKSDLDSVTADLAKTNARLEALTTEMHAAEQDISSLKALLVGLEKDNATSPGPVIADALARHKASIAEKETSLVKILGEISQLNKDKTSQLKDVNDVQKDNKINIQKQSEAANDTLTSDSRQYVAMNLKTAKLVAEQKAALNGNKQSVKSMEDALKVLEENTTRHEKELEQADELLAKTLTRLNGQKDRINDLNEIVRSAAEKENEINRFKETNRPEDFGSWIPNAFSMFIEYNGSIHKILEECSLTGHGHVVAQGGEVIKEYYTFICRKIR